MQYFAENCKSHLILYAHLKGYKFLDLLQWEKIKLRFHLSKRVIMKVIFYFLVHLSQRALNRCAQTSNSKYLMLHFCVRTILFLS